MNKWLRRLRNELEAEREATRLARSVSRDVLHEVADVVLQLRSAAEDLERVMRDLAEREEEEDRRRGTTSP